ncbi:MAG: type I-C CRISPR-associated endonuclease Cas1c [Bacteroidota bacterium]
MKKLLNTLYVTTSDAYLHRHGETVVVKVGGEEKLRIPIHNLESIVCFGPMTCSTPLMELCGERNVHLAFFSEHGRFYGRVEGHIHGNVLLRKEQFAKSADDAFAATLARAFVLAKLANCRNVLLRAAREQGEGGNVEEIRRAAAELAEMAGRLRSPVPLEQLRGIEGEAARLYFSVFNHLIVAQKGDFVFSSRSRRPPLDNVNAMLSFVYVVLGHDIQSALLGVGLDPYVGFLHADRPGRPSLALDLLEEFRPVLGDRLVLTLINRQQVKAKGFEKTPSGAVIMDEETRKTLLSAYQKRKQEEISHPFIGESVPLGLLPHVQAMLLARFLRGEMDAYPAFVWK